MPINIEELKDTVRLIGRAGGAEAPLLRSSHSPSQLLPGSPVTARH